MHWFNWLLVALFSFEILYKIIFIGKDRKTITPELALGDTILFGLLIAGVIVFNG